MKHFIFVLNMLLYVLQIVAQVPTTLQGNIGLTQNMGQLLDTEGQTHSDVLFYTHAGNVQFYTQSDRIVYAFHQANDSTNLDSMYRADIVFSGANTEITPNTIEQMSYNNYYLDHTGANGLNNVPVYRYIQYPDLYTGIDLFVGNQAGIAYEFVINAGADPLDIVLQIQGTDDVSIDANGAFLFKTPLGGIIYDKPTAYQEIGGIKTAVNITYLLSGTTLSFVVGAYDTNYPLQISTISLPQVPSYMGGTTTNYWSTFIQGGLSDENLDVWIDNTNRIYTTGGTQSANFPNTTGIWTYAAVYDAFICKFNANRGLAWSTYFGGNSDDLGKGIVANNTTGHVYIAGFTKSFNMSAILTSATSSFSHQDITLAGAAGDIFILRLNSAGVMNIPAGCFASYFGGVGAEDVHCMTIDNLGNVYFGGYVDASSFSTFPYVSSISGGYSPPFSLGTSGDDEGFVAEINTNNQLVWCAAIGGDNGVAGLGEELNGMTVDAYNNLYVIGSSTSLGSAIINAPYSTSNPNPSFPLVQDPNLPTGQFVRNHSGMVDAYIIKFNSKNIIMWSTLFGGAKKELFYNTGHNNNGITVDINGNIYITGSTQSNVTGSNYPAFPIMNYGGINGYNTGAHKGGTSTLVDGFIARFTPQNKLQWSTLFGTSADDYATQISSNLSGKIYAAGTITRGGSLPPITNFPLKAQPSSYFQTTFGGQQELYLAQFDVNGTYDHVTFFGGSGNELIHGLVTDATAREIVMVGSSYSPNFPLQDIPGSLDYYDGILNTAGALTKTDAFVSNLRNICVPCTRQTDTNIETSETSLIYPNPNQGNFTYHNTEGKYIQQIHIYNSVGQLVHILTIKDDSVEIAVNATTLTTGLYYAKVVSAEGETTHKIMIQ